MRYQTTSSQNAQTPATQQYHKKQVPHETLTFWQNRVLPLIDWVPDETQRYNWVPSENTKLTPSSIRNTVIHLIHHLYDIPVQNVGEILLWNGSEDLDWHADGDGDDECKDKDVVIIYLDVHAKNQDDIGTISIGKRSGSGQVDEIETIVPYSGLSLMLPTTGDLVHKVSRTNVSARRITLLVGIKA